MGSLKKLWGWYPTGEKWVKLKVDSTGKVLISSIQTKAKAYLSADQLNIPTGAWTLVNLDTVDYDIGSDFDTVNHKFIIPKDGYYLLIGKVHYKGGSVVADKIWGVNIYDGSNNLSLSLMQSASIFELSAITSSIEPLTAGTEIFLYTYHNAGVNTPDINPHPALTYLVVHLLSV